MALPIPHPPIPYGMANFRTVRRDGFYYVDKTRFVYDLEKVRFAFFVRPRRFGKTLWLTMLDAYYNRTAMDEFEAVFAGTHIGEQPTANRSRYVVLYFDFSTFKQALPTLELKYLKPSARTDQVTALADEARRQLRRYLADEALHKRHPHVHYVGLALVYHGWQLAHAEAVEADG